MAAEISLEGHVEHLDKNLTHVVAHPLLKNIYEEAAVLFATDRALGHEVAGLRVQQALAAGLLAPAEVGDIDGFRTGALDDGNKLHPLCTHFIAEETIDGTAVLLVGGVDRAQDVEFDSVLAQVPPALHNFVESALLAAVDPIRVVELAWTVNAQADQKIVFLEEDAPLIIEKDAVGLKSVLHDLIGSAVLFNELDGAPEELELHQRRLAPLPSHGYLRSAVRLQQLADVGLECRIRHPALFVRIERLLGQEEAISAIDIASGPARLRQQVKAWWDLGRPGVSSN